MRENDWADMAVRLDAGMAWADVVPLAQGDAVVFAVNQRPVAGKRHAPGGATPWRQPPGQ
jgi:hypothetical protein